MKSVLVLLTLLVIPGQILAAPEDSTAADPGRPNSLKDGAWAAQFTIDDWFNSAGVFFKHHFRDDAAVRFGAGFSVGTSEGDISTDTLSAPLETGSETRDRYSVSFEVIALKYSNPLASAHFYYGVGPFFGLSRSENEQQLTHVGGPLSGRSDYRQNETDSWQAGAKVVIGAEWFASRALSLNLEWGVSGGYRSTTREYTNDYAEPYYSPTHGTEEFDELFIEGGSARFGLSIYF